ncbi:MAG: BACON domain-containing carbohydrate-binding protein, partial [Bacteroidales bacterium]
TSNTTWTITDDGDWLTVNPTDGTGNTAVTVTAGSENTSPEPRSAIVTISADDAPDQTTVTVTQEGVPTITQDINLTSGWNILSFSTEPDDMSMMAILNPLIIEGTLIKVQDEKGSAIERLPDPIGWIDNIGQMSLSEGYKIKVAVDAQLSITGQPVSIPYNVPLDAGWNIAGYPFTTSQAAMPVFQPLISAGSLLKVQDELGNAIEELPAPIGWVNNINNLNPGDGYKIKTSVNTTLIITDPGKGDYFEGEAINVRPSHFNPVYTGNGLDHMNIYLKNPTADGSALQAGDEIGVFDGNRCVGATVINDLNLEFLPLIVSLDDPTTQEKDGFTEGNPIEFRLWNSRPGFESSAQKTELLKNYNLIFERSGTSVLTVDFKTPTDKILDDAFPNPSSDRTIFTFRVVRESEVRLEIADISGNLVKVLIDQTMPEGIHIIEWDNCSMAGRRVSAGLYFYRLRLNNFLQTKQLVVQ